MNMIKRYVVRAQTIMPSEGVVQRASPVLSVASPSYSPVEDEICAKSLPLSHRTISSTTP